MAEKSYFPIKTNTACLLKWTWSTLVLYDGTTSSCHRNKKLPIPDDFSQFHNTEKKLEDRKLMLEGKWPTGGCEFCQKVEQSGGSSDRQFHLDIPDLNPPELLNDPTAINVTPNIVEVYLDNVCNMKCIYCWDGFSSRIQEENRKFGEFESNGVKIVNKSQRSPDIEKNLTKLLEWLGENHTTLQRLVLLGGEPLYQQKFENILHFLETHQSPQLEFNIVTNLKISYEKLKKFIGRMKQLVATKKIKRLDITCSIDCWGKEQEYLRYGINMEAWRKNFEFLVDQKWIILNINQTITGLGIKSMLPLIEYINHHRQTRAIGHYGRMCWTPSFFYPGIFGPGFFDDDLDIILKTMPNDTWQHQHAYKIMLGGKTEISNRPRNNDEIKKLVTYLDEIDRRRKLNWRATFPWLEQEVKNVV